MSSLGISRARVEGGTSLEIRRGILLAGLSLLLCYQLAYWPLSSEFNIRYAVLGLPLAMLAALLAPGAAGAMLGAYRLPVLLVSAFFALAALASANSPDPSMAAYRWLAYAGHAAVAVAGFIAVSALGATLRQMLMCIGAACCVLCLAEIASIVRHWALFSRLGEGRIYAPTYFNHIRNFAHVPTVLFIASTGFGLLARGVAVRWVTYGVSTAALCLVVWAGGRVSMIIVPLAAGLLLGLVPASERLRKGLIVALMMALAVVLVRASGQDQMWSQMSQRMQSDLSVLSAAAENDSLEAAPRIGRLGSGRLDLWQSAWRGFGAHPFIGSGGEAFFLLQMAAGVDPLKVSAHPHNWLLGLVLEFGLSGLLLVSAALIILGRRLQRSYRQAPAEERGVAGLTAVLLVILSIYGLLSGTLYYAWPVNVAVLCLGALTGFDSTVRKSMSHCLCSS